MIRNKFYRYGDDSVKIPAHVHFGKDLLDRIVEYGDRVAVITAKNDEAMTFRELAQKSVDIALSLARMGVKKGDVVSICSENRMELVPTAIGIICAGAVFTTAQQFYGTVPLELRIQMTKPKVMFMSPKTYKTCKGAIESVGYVEKFIVYDDNKDGVYKNGCHNTNNDYKLNGEHTENGVQNKTTKTNGEHKQDVSTNGDSYAKQNGGLNLDGSEVSLNGDSYAKQNGHQNLDGHDAKQNGGLNLDGYEDDTISFKEFLTETCKVEDFIPTPVEGWKDPVMMVFTSGSTGVPKAMPHTHLGFLMNCFARTNESFKFSPVLISHESQHNFFIKFAMKCLWRGCTCIFTDMAEREREYFRAIEKYKVRIVYLLPVHVALVVDIPYLHEYDLSSVEIILTVGGPLAKKLYVAAKKKLPNLRHVYLTYGMTESQCICSYVHVAEGPRDDGSVGEPLHGYVLKVADMVTGEALGPNQRGEIRFTSKTLTPGYIKIGHNKVLNFDEEGFFRTGDFGYYDDKGYFYVLGRIEHMIKHDGILISPAEIEALLCEISDVKEAGVASVNGALAAAIILENDAIITETQLLDYIHSKISSRLQGGIHFVKNIPRLGPAATKIDRPGLLVQLTKIMENNK